MDLSMEHPHHEYYLRSSSRKAFPGKLEWLKRRRRSQRGKKLDFDESHEVESEPDSPPVTTAKRVQPTPKKQQQQHQPSNGSIVHQETTPVTSLPQRPRLSEDAEVTLAPRASLISNGGKSIMNGGPKVLRRYDALLKQEFYSSTPEKNYCVDDIHNHFIILFAALVVPLAFCAYVLKMICLAIFPSLGLLFVDLPFVDLSFLDLPSRMAVAVATAVTAAVSALVATVTATPSALAALVTATASALVSLVPALLAGLLVTLVTSLVVYWDSREPGVNPPSPLSPSRRDRDERGLGSDGICRFHLAYTVALINGFVTAAYFAIA